MKVPGVDALRDALAALSLDTRGHKDVLKKRLRTASKRKERQPDTCKISKQTRPGSQDFDSYLVLDFEATCQRNEPAHGSFFGFPNEIIEFPVVLLQWRLKPNKRTRIISDSSDDTASLSSSSSVSSSSSSLRSSPEPESEPISENIPDSNWQLEIIDEFRKFVKPTWRPKLSKFCTELTGITQQDVDPAETFAETLETFCFDFMQKHNLFTKTNKTVWVTDGPWDLRDFISKQCHISGIERPPYLSGPYIDLRSSSTSYFSSTAIPSVGADGNTISPPSTRAMGSANIPAVLDKLGLGGFQGREHSGIDDVRNIARILQELVRYERGWRVTANARIKGKERSWDWMKKKGEVDWPHPPGE